MVNKTNPQILNQDLKVEKRPSLYLSKENFTFSVGLADETNAFLIDPQIFEFAITIYHQDSENYEMRQFSLKLCEENDYQLHKELFHKLKLNKTYCLPDEVLKIDGYWDEDQLNYFYVDLKKCENTTENSSCKSNEEIEKFLQTAYIDIYIDSPNIEFSNYYTPFKHELSIFYQKLSINMYKIMEIYLKSSVFQTDQGWFFESLQFIKGFVVGNYLYDLGAYEKNTILQIFYSISVYSSEKKSTISRRYQKVQDILAQFGGVCNILLIIGFFLAKVENHYSFIYETMNKLYDFQVKTQEKDEKIHKKPKSGNFLSKNQDKELVESSANSLNKTAKSLREKLAFQLNFTRFFKKPEVLKPQISKIERFHSFKQRKKSLFFGFCSYLWLLLKKKKFRLNKREVLFMKAERKITEETDIVNIVQKLQDIEKLKKVLLTEEQLFFFELLEKPVISTKERENAVSKEEIMMISSRNHEKTVNESKKIRKFREAYLFLKEKAESSHCDKQLLELIDEEILNVVGLAS